MHRSFLILAALALLSGACLGDESAPVADSASPVADSVPVEDSVPVIAANSSAVEESLAAAEVSVPPPSYPKSNATAKIGGEKSVYGQAIQLNPDEFMNRGKEYSLYCGSANLVNFFRAWRSCMDLGMELASIDSQHDNNLMKDAIGSYALPVWTSGIDLGKEGFWIWLVNLRKLGYWNNFVSWAAAEPNNSGGTENCMTAVVASGIVLWNDVPCDLNYCYVCQKFLT